MQIPKEFVKKTKPLPLKFNTTGEQLKRYADQALINGNVEVGSVFCWMEDNTTFTSYSVGSWVFLAVNGAGEPLGWRDTCSSLGWNVFENPDEPTTLSLDEALEHFNVFYEDLTRNIGLVS